MDVAAALVGVDATVYVVARRPAISFGERVKHPRSWWDRLRAPMSGLGQGWRSRFCTDAPLAFHAFPERFRVQVVKRHLGPAPGWFVKDRVKGRITTLLSHRITDAVEDAEGATLHLADEEGHRRTLRADHLIAGTGYRADVRRIPFLDPDLRDHLATVEQSPKLSRQFELTVPGLYFVGLTAAYSFGPLMRFAFGARFAARRLSSHLASRTKYPSVVLTPASTDASAPSGSIVNNEAGT